MDGRELLTKLTYHGMSRGIRELALRDNLATADELAVMAEIDVCELVAQNYQIVNIIDLQVMIWVIIKHASYRMGYGGTATFAVKENLRGVRKNEYKTQTQNGNNA